MTTPRILFPGEVNTESYITLGLYDTQNQAENFVSYMKCKLSRLLLRQAISSVNINREVFKFVPIQDFDKPWTDEELYAKYNLSEEEIAFTESLIRPMEGGDD